MASVKDLTRFGVNLSDARMISPEDFNALVKQGCQPIVGDVLIAKDGNSALDTVCCVDEPLDAVLLSSVAILRPNPNVLDSHYLKHYLSSPDVIDYLKTNFISGAAIPRVVLRDFKKAEIRLPSLTIQKSIAASLDLLDNRIKLLHETNATLEAIAQALFKSWFVDFDPVRAKMAGRAPEGMDEATAALFPDAMEETELGLVPKGWNVASIGSTCTLGRGASPRPIQNFMGGDIPWIKIADATASDGLFIFDTKERVNQAGASKSVAVSPGDLILSNSASCGIPTFVDIHGCIHDGWLYFRNFQGVSKYLLFFWLRRISSHLISIADGSVQKNLNIGLVSAQPILLPAPDVLRAFDEFARLLLEEVKENCRQALVLADLRDSLLPRLISGQLRLPEANVLAAGLTAH